MEKNTTNGEPTISDVLEAINEFSTNVDKRFDTLETRVTRIEETMVTKDDLRHEVDRLDSKIGKLRSDLIDHIADQNLKLRGDIIQVVRGEDRKVVSLVQLLVQKSLITKKEAEGIVSMQPFPGTV